MHIQRLVFGTLLALASASRLQAEEQPVAMGELDIRETAGRDAQGSFYLRYSFPEAIGEGDTIYLPDRWGEADGLSALIALDQRLSSSWRRISKEQLRALKATQQLSYIIAPLPLSKASDFRVPVSGKKWSFAFGPAIILPQAPVGRYKVVADPALFSNILPRRSILIANNQLSDSFFLIGEDLHYDDTRLPSGQLVRKAWATGLSPAQVSSFKIIGEAIQDIIAVTGTWPDVYSVALVPFIRPDLASAFQGTAVRDGMAIMLSGDSKLTDHRLALYHEVAHQITGYELGTLGSNGVSEENYWFYEGITDAIARIVLFERGRISEGDYRESWTKVLQSFDEANEKFAINSGSEPGERGVFPAYYQYWRGALIGLDLHFRIQQTQQQKDGLLFAIRRAAEINPSRSPIENFLEALDELDTSLRLTVDSDLADVRKLNIVGNPAYSGCLKIDTTTQPKYELGFEFSTQSDGTFRIEKVSDGSAAKRMGLREGMVVTKILQSSGGNPNKQTIFEISNAGRPTILQFYPRTEKQYVSRYFDSCRAI